MISIAKLMIESVNPEITDEHRLKRLKCRKEMFNLLEEFSPDDRLRTVDNLTHILRFDCPDYRTFEDEVIDELVFNIKALMDDISTGKETALGDIYLRLKKMIPDDE